MQFELLSRIQSPRDLQSFSDDQLVQLASEIREALCMVCADRTAHFASNLGVVELAIALHLVFDFSKDRLIWDTGHQVYPHKLLTGRFRQFHTIRRRGGLMGYPNPAESPYDLFMTGHAGASVSTVLGLKAGDDLVSDEKRRAVAVIGDAALPSGIVFEAFNNAGGLKKELLVILNDNKMGICPRVGGLAEYLDRARMGSFYSGLKRDITKLLNKLPSSVGGPMGNALGQLKEALKALLHGGMLFEELGFRYVGPVDGHDIFALKRYLEMVKDAEGPVLLHVFTEKGHGFKPACEDPVSFHTPAPFIRNGDGEIIRVEKDKQPSYTDVVSREIYRAMKQNERVVVLTAAMCAGNKLQKVRKDFPDRFFDTGICEGHAVAFAAGMAKAGVRPIVDIYSTFLQRAFDQIFQEVALQNLPVTFCMDRAGICGADGPTHHGAFDNTYMRVFPNMVLMAPGDEQDVPLMLRFALQYNGPTAIRYPKAPVDHVERPVTEVELGQAEVYDWGEDGMFVAYGTLFARCVQAAARLRQEGLDVGVINARFAKPLDTETILRAVRECRFVLTVEEGALCGGFGSAVLEAASAAGLNTAHVRCLGLPDRFIEHGERDELLADLGLDVDGLVQAARELAGRVRQRTARRQRSLAKK